MGVLFVEKVCESAITTPVVVAEAAAADAAVSLRGQFDCMCMSICSAYCGHFKINLNFSFK